MGNFVTLSAIDPGVKHLGLAMRKHRALPGPTRPISLGPVVDFFSAQIGGLNAIHTAERVVELWGPCDSLMLVLAESFAYSQHYQMANLGRVVGALELWASERGIQFQFVPIAWVKKALGLKGNAPRKAYVEVLRRLYPTAPGDDARVACAILDNFGEKVWRGELKCPKAI